MSEKNVVRYSSFQIMDSSAPVVGQRVLIYPVDHPSPYVINGSPAFTSPVVAYDEVTAQIETQNTLYVPDSNA